MTINISLIRANPDISTYQSGDINEHTIDSYSNLFYPYLVDNGGNNKIVSLNIDIINSKELSFHDDAPNKNWTTSLRQIPNLIQSNEIWGFTNALHQTKRSKALSNAFCFGGQELTFYVSSQGHSNGKIDDAWVYCKTNLSVSSIDLTSGNSSSIVTFSDFESSLDDTSRFFTWTVPSSDDIMFAEYGLFGIVVIKLEVTNTYYEDANRETPLTGSYPNTHTSYLQLLIYSGAKELIEVDAGSVNILTETPLYTDSLSDIFAKTTFESLSGLNQNTLTDAQKRSIIADQVAVLFMSQHPVLLADHYPSKILGIGIKQAEDTLYNLDKSITHGDRTSETVVLFKDRLFGMFAAYKAFNFSFDLEDLIPDNAQSSQSLLEPTRIITTDTVGNVSDDFGVRGILFNPYSTTLNNAEFLENVPNNIPFVIDLFNNNLVDITNITITNENDNVLSAGDITAKITFDITIGSDKITQIRYIIITQNNQNYHFYEDSTGTELTHTFDLLYAITTDDIVKAQIDMEDVDGQTHSFYKNMYIHDSTESPRILDLKAYQRTDGSRMANIDYYYDSVGEINNSFVTFKYSINGGSTWLSSSSLTGDYGANIMPGKRRIGWDISSDLNSVSLSSIVLCDVKIEDVDKLTSNTSSSALVWDLDIPDVAIRKISKQEEVLYLEESTSSSSSSSSSIDSSSSSSSSESSYDLEDCYDAEGYGTVAVNGEYTRTGTYFNEYPVYSNGTYYLYRAFTYVNPPLYWAIGLTIGNHYSYWLYNSTINYLYPTNGGNAYILYLGSAPGGTMSLCLSSSSGSSSSSVEYSSSSSS